MLFRAKVRCRPARLQWAACSSPTESRHLQRIRPRRGRALRVRAAALVRRPARPGSRRRPPTTNCSPGPPKLGDEHEQRHLDELRARADDADVVVIGRPAYTVAGLTAAAEPDAARRRAPGTRHLPGRHVRRPVRRFRRLPGPRRRRGTGCATPSWPARSRSRRCCSSPRTPTLWPRPESRWPPRSNWCSATAPRSSYRVDELLPVYRPGARRCERLLDGHLAGGTRGRLGGRRACARASAVRNASIQVRAHDDLLLVAGMRVSQRARLIDAGITTLRRPGRPHRPGPRAVGAHRQVADGAGPASGRRPGGRQAAVRGRRPAAADGAARRRQGRPVLRLRGRPAVDRRRPRVGAGIPVGRADRRATSSTRSGRTTGPANARPSSTSSPWCASGSSAIPGMHIYHYAAYEKSTLLRLAGRYGVGENDVDDLLRNGVLVDLYPVGAQEHSGRRRELQHQVARAALHGQRAAQRRGHHRRRLDHRSTPATARCATTAAPTRRRRCSRRSRTTTVYDCRSTRRLRDWMMARAIESGVPPRGPQPVPRWRRRSTPATTSTAQAARSSRATASRNAPPNRPPSRWWLPPGVFTSARTSRSGGATSTASTIRSTNGRTTATSSSPTHAEIVNDWHQPPRARKPQRHLRLFGEIANGELSHARCTRCTTRLRPPASPTTRTAAGSARSTVLECDNPEAPTEVIIVERQPKDGDVFDQLPFALTPGPPDQHQAAAGLHRRHRRAGRRRAAEPARRRA